MSRLSKITFLMNIQILYLFVIYFPTIIFVGARVGFIKNTWAAIIVFLYFAFIFGLLSSIPVEFFSERALRKYRNSGEAAVIPIELNASNNFKKLIINDFSTFYYKKITTINSISVHKISTFNYHYCKELLGNFYDKIIFFFPSLRRRYSRHRFSRWFTNINIFLYYGDAPINDLEKRLSVLSEDTLPSRDITREMTALAPEIAQVTLTQTKSYDAQGSAVDTMVICLIRMKNQVQIPQAEQQRIVGWLQTRTKNDNVKLYVE